MQRLLAGFALLTAALSASALPPGFLNTPVASNWNQAVGLCFAPDGRMFVWEKAGRVWNVENGVKASQPLIDLSEEVGDWRDYGLLGFTVDPNFCTNGYIYLEYAVDYHHLAYFGTAQYSPGANEYFRDTIARLTRYQCDAATGFRTLIPGSRTILIGESISTGIPLCNQSHGPGSLIFGEDGTLLVSCGDGASYDEADVGGTALGSSNTALADGIISVKEDVGAYRAQLIDSHSGKILRIDPATGDGVPSNPYYDAGAPRAPRSRVWALGLRNPFRVTLRPGTGNPNPAAADPGTLYIGDVGWLTWEELNIAAGPGVNFGWPAFEGLNANSEYTAAAPQNLDAPNPLLGTGGCAQPFFTFANLLVQEVRAPAAPSWPNPCNSSQQVPANLRFQHTRPVIDWGHNNPARVAIFNSMGLAFGAIVGEPLSGVAGIPWIGSSSTGGVWYTGSDFPAEYQNTYFHADFAGAWIRQFIIDGDNTPGEVRIFAPEGEPGAVVALATNPVNGGLHYIAYNGFGDAEVREVRYVVDPPPVAVVSATPFYGPAPLTVALTGSDSFDPEDQALTYSWDFGDGSLPSARRNPRHIYGEFEDITAQGNFTTRVHFFNPPRPIGGGNWDSEIVRDGELPPVGSDDSYKQYDTYHGNDQAAGDFDWAGYTFPSAHPITRLLFQEGKHFIDGGWFDTIFIQYQTTPANWITLPAPAFTPSYPRNNGVNFETFIIEFPTVNATGIRLVGAPGGSSNFISVGELRVLEEAPLGGPPKRYDATLTVRDTVGFTDSASVLISVNNTPPEIEITSPVDGALYPREGFTTIPLAATITDAEHSPAQLACTWQSILHHNEHEHPEPPIAACTASAAVSAHGDAGDTFYFEFTLTVTDAAGLSTTRSALMYPAPACPGDADFSGAITFADIVATLAYWGSSYRPTPGSGPGDANGDGMVDFSDITSSLANYGACPG